MKKLAIAILPIILSFSIYANENENNSNKNEIVIDLLEADIFANDPGNYDASYVYDENYIKVKSDELLQEVYDDYEALDNIILYEALMRSFKEWEGTKYKWGGDSKNGIDCSALTRRVYRSVFNNYELPRVSVDQVKKGRRVDNSELKPGDLLYFRPENRVNHVGVYLGNSLFINASSSKGVILSSLNNVYWKKYYKYAVRVDKAREI
ncbi:C40 family peptidase [Oceanivirga miroungae]|uniref:P60 extracellular protein, invasion associated protein Iap n=1 Tax=Oceanivirga miroungae TaxID=1130046 RepID=A0A6I8M7B3_9FUSO|nr:P60 extracellular protein, invasion associated protein Iap [Oceanivirga miroungae]